MWTAQGFDVPAVAVNLSARQFRQLDLAQTIQHILTETGPEPGRLQIELTEGALVEDVDYVIQVMAAFKRIGIGVAIDGFGTGHSSLSDLKLFNVDTLKIDRSFVSSVIAPAHGWRQSWQ